MSVRIIGRKERDVYERMCKRNRRMIEEGRLKSEEGSTRVDRNRYATCIVRNIAQQDSIDYLIPHACGSFSHCRKARIVSS